MLVVIIEYECEAARELVRSPNVNELIFFSVL